MRFILIIGTFLLALSAKSQQLGAGIGAYQNVYQRLSNPNFSADTLYNSSGQFAGLVPGGELRLFADFNEKFAISVEGEFNLRLYNVAYQFQPFQGLGSLSLSTHLEFYTVLGRPEKLDGAILLGLGGGMQMSKTEFIYRPEEYKTYPRDWFRLYTGEIYLGLGETVSSKGVFFKYGRGPNGAAFFQTGIRTVINIVGLRKKLSDDEKENAGN